MVSRLKTRETIRITAQLVLEQPTKQGERNRYNARSVLDQVIKFDYTMRVTASKLKRLLRSYGCTFTEGANHTLVHRNGITVTMPRHPAKEVRTGTCNAILRQLNIK